MIETVFTLRNPRTRTAQQLLEAGQYDHVNYVVQKAMPLPVDDQVVGNYEVVLIGAPEGATHVHVQDVLDASTTAKLRRPTYPDGLLFGEQYRQEHEKGMIVLLHEKLHVWSGCTFNFALTVNRGKGDRPVRRGTSFVSVGAGIWQPETRFLFVRPRKKV